MKRKDKRSKHDKNHESSEKGSTFKKDSNDTDPRPVNPAEAIAKRASQMLAKKDRHFDVGTLEEALLMRFPAENAEDWDRTGLTVGERSLPVTSVAVALDPTVSAIRKAASIGADVLITHHPLFLAAPDDFEPADSIAAYSGAGVWAAIQNRVAVMSFHTALDVSTPAQYVLPNMLGLNYKNHVVVPIANSKNKGYGQFCKVPKIGEDLQTLSQLSAKCVSVFGRAPRVWGDPSKTIKSAVTATGSASNVAEEAFKLGVDCLICGEIKYHSALDLAEAGMCIIELGHDVSELPLTAVLASTLADIGISPDKITILDQSNNWHAPESIRL